MGINRHTPIVLAGSDGPLANLGIGAINPGETAITIGTSGAIRQFSSEPLLDSKQEISLIHLQKTLGLPAGRRITEGSF